MQMASILSGNIVLHSVACQAILIAIQPVESLARRLSRINLRADVHRRPCIRPDCSGCNESEVESGVCKSPGAQGIEVADVEATLQALMDTGRAAGDLAGHARITALR